MASTIQINTCFGGTDTAPGTDNSDVTSGTLRYKFADDNTADAVNPLAIPGAGTNYSFWKHTYLRMTVRPAAEVVNNLKFYTDGANGYGTGVDLMVSDQLGTHTAAANTNYQVDDHTTGSSSEDMDAGTNNHTICTTLQTVFGFTSAAPMAITISEAGAVINLVGEVSDFVITQMTVASTASPGTLPAETMTYRYDET